MQNNTSNITPEQIIDTWETRRKLKYWRWTSLLFFTVLLFMLFGNSGPFERSSLPMYSSYVARVNLDGVIYSDQMMVDHIKSLSENHNVKAVFFHINSPGGSPVGGEMIYAALRHLSAHKPVVALLDDIAASAGYMVALGADHIVSHRTTITASIGAVMYSPNVEELMGKLGIRLETYKSSPIKALPSPMETTTPEAQRLLHETVWDSYQTFVGMVHERRNLPLEDLLRVADGRIMTGNQALAAGLVDELGGEDAAMNWLLHNAKLESKIPIYDVPYDDESVGTHNFLKNAMHFMKDTQALYKMLLSQVWINR